MVKASRQRRARERLISLIVASSLFMLNLDGTIVSTALPTMARVFGADPVRMNVALTAYLFAVALFVPASGWLADRFGTRIIYAASIAVFTIGSVLCGRSQTLGFLVFSRMIQGLGGAMLMPVARLVLLRTIPKARLVAAMAWVTVPGLIGPVLGPPVGGLIIEHASWRWIFDINVPIGLLGMFLVARFVPNAREETPGAFDAVGLVLSGAALAGFIAVMELAGRDILAPEWVFAIAVGGGLAGYAYVQHASAQIRPLLDFSLMRLPSFSVSVLAGAAFRVGVGATPFLLPMMIQIGFGRGPLESGMITFAAAAGAIFMKPAAQWALRRWGFRSTLVVNGLLCGVGFALYAALRPSWPLALIYLVLFTTGLLRSLQFTAFNTIAYAEIPPARMSAATTLYSAAQQVSLTIGIPIAAGVLQLSRAIGGHAQPQLADFSWAFLVVAAISVLAGPMSLALPADSGEEMSGRRGS